MLTYELPLSEIVVDFYDRLRIDDRGATRPWTTSPRIPAPASS